MLGLGRNASDSFQKDGVLPKINNADFWYMQRLKDTIALKTLTIGSDCTQLHCDIGL